MKKQEKGQSLIEVLAALAVVIIVILALIAVVTVSIRNATFAKNQSLATRYAQEAIEEARELRDSNREAFFDDPDSCGKTDVSVSPFTIKRICSLEGEESDKMKIEVTVSWTDTKGEHQSQLTTYLTAW